ncbi:MAG TPA: glycosyltransferase family 2 protein [Candidatus Saccharimonadales bacterium]|nr:glycosyltransferase family 2 protein [Candidatus Saccharimonadales bacterium]
MKLSIVATLYQSAPYIEEFHYRASKVARQLVGEDFEIVLVNDGSPDNSLDIAIALTEIDDHIVVVDLSRNFGHHKAMMTGLSQAKGKQIFLIDIDLEEEPEYLIVFARQMESTSCDVVYGVQAKRRGGWLTRWSGEWFYIFFRAATGLALPANAVVARLMTRRYVDALLRHEEREVFINALWHITGFTQIPVPIKKHDTSTTTYTFHKKLSLAVNSITSFSSSPLIAILYTGLSIFFISTSYMIYLIFQRIFLSKPLIGWMPLMSSIWIIGGLIMTFIGIIGVYIAKMFSEIKHRPYTIIRDIYEKHGK